MKRKTTKQIIQPKLLGFRFITRTILTLFIISWVLSLLVPSLFDGESLMGNTAVIQIKGPIYTEKSAGMFGTQGTSSIEIIEFIEKAEKDSGIKAIIFDINSPGGSPVASSEIANKIKSLNKPVISVISDMGASGAYWIASSTPKIFANKMSIVGSIGVIASYLEFAEFIDDHNVTYRRLVSGKYKDIGNMFKEMTPEEELQMQAIIDKMHQYFIEAVAVNRNLSIEHVSELATGMFYLGEESKELGLIDYIGNLNSAKEYLEKELNTTIELTIYEKEKSLKDMFNIMSNEKFFYIGQGISKNILEKDFSITT